MPRPQGEIRQAMAQALQQLGSGGGAANAYQLAERAQVGYGVARETLKNMARAGEAANVGREKPAGGLRWMTLYAVPDDGLPQPWGGIEALAEVMHTFPAGVTPD